MANIQIPKETTLTMSINLSYNTMKRLYEMAAQENVTINNILRKLIEKGLNDNGGK